MTPEKFEAEFIDVLAGMLYDASVHERVGKEFAMWYRAQYAKLRVTIRQMHSAMAPPKPEVKTNGRSEEAVLAGKHTGRS